MRGMPLGVMECVRMFADIRHKPFRNNNATERASLGRIKGIEPFLLCRLSANNPNYTLNLFRTLRRKGIGISIIDANNRYNAIQWPDVFITGHALWCTVLVQVSFGSCQTLSENQKYVSVFYSTCCIRLWMLLLFSFIMIPYWVNRELERFNRFVRKKHRSKETKKGTHPKVPLDASYRW